MVETRPMLVSMTGGNVLHLVRNVAQFLLDMDFKIRYHGYENVPIDKRVKNESITPHHHRCRQTSRCVKKYGLSCCQRQR